ncbi:MAG: radical SAM protein [Deltaproteobacteria bacterium]|nr:radical SAM protein [Deltaproteobacteria bacterium]
MSAPFILLVNPWIYDFAAYDLWIRPLGLLSIASVLKKNGCGVHLIDCLDTHHPAMRTYADAGELQQREFGQGRFFKQNIPKPACLAGIPRNYSRYGMYTEVFQNELECLERPDAVLVGTMMTYWHPAVADCIKLIKNIFPDVPVLAGGVYASLCPDHAAACTGADYIVPGPFENSAVETLEAILHKQLQHIAADTVLRPECELLSSKKVLPLMTSRGCPLGCPYCASRLLSPSFQQREPLSVADEIEYWHVRYGTTDFAFYDDALLVHPEKHIVPLLESVIERGLPVRFHAPNGLHVRIIDERIACLMQRAGVKTLRLGLESADESLQKATGGKASRKEFTRAAESLQSAGYTEHEVGAYILAGLPGQCAQSVRSSISFVKDHGVRPYITEYSPIPGTDFWKKAVDCSPFPIEKEPLFHNNSLLPCRSASFTVDDLEALKRESRKT